MAVVELSTTYAEPACLGGERDTVKERESIESQCLRLHQPCLVLAEPAQHSPAKWCACCLNKALQVGESSPQGY